MQARFYPDALATRGIVLAVPEQDEQGYLHDVYMEELVKGIVLPETRDRLLGIVSRMKERHGIQGLILGGTDLSVILHDGMVEDVRFLDTTQIHVQAGIDEILS
jgi:aspartate racemase